MQDLQGARFLYDFTHKWMKTFPSAEAKIYPNFIKFDAIPGKLVFEQTAFYRLNQ